MRQTLTKICLLIVGLAVAISVFAGPMPQEKNIAPVAPPCTWTGFYIGLNVGVGTLESTFTDRNDYDDSWSGTRAFSEAAFIGGGQVGYNYQWKELVFGIEADAAYTSADIHRNNFLGDTEGVEDEGFSDHAKIDLLGSIRARMGISLNENRALLYATGGGAFAHGEWSNYYHYYQSTYGDYYENRWDGEDWRWGWTGGIGFEYALNCHWSLKAEGNYYWFAEDTANTECVGEYANTDDCSYGGYTNKYTYGDTFWTAKVGLNYKF